MKHLSREELIDSLEGSLALAREAHMDACPSCRAERASLEQVLQRVAAIEVPEPSPLFWEHFSARVRESAAQQAGWTEQADSSWTERAGWHTWVWPRWAVGSATLVVCVTLGWASWHDYGRRHFIEKPGVVRIHEGAPDSGDPGLALMVSDEDWNLVMSMAEDVTVDDADEPEPGLVIRPGATDRAFTDLSSEQRTELARLLTAEMTRPAS
jgi:hypothetical protein